MARWIVAACSIGLVTALAAGVSDAKGTKKKAEKVEYLRAAGSEPPVAQLKKGKTPVTKVKKAAQ